MSPCLAMRRERTRSHDISTRLVRQSTRSVRLTLLPLKTASCGDIFEQFEILVGTPRQATSYGDMRRVVHDNRRHMASSLRDVASS